MKASIIISFRAHVFNVRSMSAFSLPNRYLSLNSVVRKFIARKEAQQFRCFSKISQDSWAADDLANMGEKLAPGTMPLTLLSEDIMKAEPSANVKRLSDEILALNMIEVSQLMHHMQVFRFHLHRYTIKNKLLF